MRIGGRNYDPMPKLSRFNNALTINKNLRLRNGLCAAVGRCNRSHTSEKSLAAVYVIRIVKQEGYVAVSTAFRCSSGWYNPRASLTPRH